MLFPATCFFGIFNQINQYLFYLCPVYLKYAVGLRKLYPDILFRKQLLQILQQLADGNRTTDGGGKSCQLPLILHKLQQPLTTAVDGLHSLPHDGIVLFRHFPLAQGFGEGDDGSD